MKTTISDWTLAVQDMCRCRAGHHDHQHDRACARQPRHQQADAAEHFDRADDEIEVLGISPDPETSAAMSAR